MSLLIPRFSGSEVLGFVAGTGTTFAGLPGPNRDVQTPVECGNKPRMAAIHGPFQILWVYYGLLIA